MPLATPPEEIVNEPPAETTAPLSTPPETTSAPEWMVVPSATPPVTTNSVPPSRIVVALAVPPEETISVPPNTVVRLVMPPAKQFAEPSTSTVVALATPPAETSYAAAAYRGVAGHAAGQDVLQAAGTHRCRHRETGDDFRSCEYEVTGRRASRQDGLGAAAQHRHGGRAAAGDPLGGAAREDGAVGQASSVHDHRATTLDLDVADGNARRVVRGNALETTLVADRVQPITFMLILSTAVNRLITPGSELSRKASCRRSAPSRPSRRYCRW